MKKLLLLLSVSIALAQNYSLSFDGVDDIVEIADNENFPSGTSDFTFSSWINIDDMADDHRIILCSKTLDHFQFVLSKTSDNANTRLDAYIGGVFSGSSVMAWTLNQWYHITVTRENGTVKFYRDGSYISNSSNNGSITRNALEIGYRTTHFYKHPFDGDIDETAIWNEALTASEITALYNSGFPLAANINSGNYTSSSNLQAYWNFNEGEGTTLTDLSGNGNHGTIDGAI